MAPGHASADRLKLCHSWLLDHRNSVSVCYAVRASSELDLPCQRQPRALRVFSSDPTRDVCSGTDTVLPDFGSSFFICVAVACRSRTSGVAGALECHAYGTSSLRLR